MKPEVVEDLKTRIVSATEGLLSYPKELQVDALHRGASIIVFTVKVKKSDFGALLGRRGGNMSALRTLLHAWGRRYGYTVHLDVIDEPKAQNVHTGVHNGGTP